MQLKPIEEQVVVVMGASSGIGREAALQFAKRGARVVVSARSKTGLDSLVEEIIWSGGNATAVVADVADFNQVRAVADRAAEVYGRLDTWAHLAAVSLYATFEQTTPEEFKRVVDVNLMGQVYGAMAALPHLRREGRGALVHVSSVEAARGFPFQSAYSASKHGMIGFVESLRLELEHEGVPINVANIVPATINTPLFSKARTKLGVKPQGVPPFYQPNVVAEAILYAAEHPVRDLVVGGAGKALIWNQRLSPTLMDMVLERTGFRLQKSDEPKTEDAPNNLFEPISGYDRVEGEYSHIARSWSLSTWLDLHPALKRSVYAGTTLGALAVLALRGFKNGGNG